MKKTEEQQTSERNKILAEKVRVANAEIPKIVKLPAGYERLRAVLALCDRLKIDTAMFIEALEEEYGKQI